MVGGIDLFQQDNERRTRRAGKGGRSSSSGGGGHLCGHLFSKWCGVGSRGKGGGGGATKALVGVCPQVRYAVLAQLFPCLRGSSISWCEMSLFFTSLLISQLIM